MESVAAPELSATRLVAPILLHNVYAGVSEQAIVDPPGGLVPAAGLGGGGDPGSEKAFVLDINIWTPPESASTWGARTSGRQDTPPPAGG